MLTRQQFQTLYDQGPDALFALFTAMQEQIETLSARVKELEDRLNTDSHNSGKPPSSDGFSKPPVSLRQKTGRKPGGQSGHPGRTLTFAPNPDVVVVHTPLCCAGCGSSLETIPGQEVGKRQVVDLPPLSLVTTEHRVHTKTCPGCGYQTTAAFPKEARQPVQYGARLKALGVYLLDFQLLPYQRIAQLFADLFDASFSPGTLFASQQAASFQLEGVLARLQKGLRQARNVHFDETGWRVMGSLHWLHLASTPLLTYYDWHKKRGKVGMDKAGILPFFQGRAIHDAWGSYFHYACTHALCNAHHLRELTAVYEQDAQGWAKTMRSLLVAIKQAVEHAKRQGRTRLSPRLEARFEAQYRQGLAEGFAQNPKNEATPGKKGRPKQSRAYNLLERLQRYQQETLAFLYDFCVPFDNNQAERDIRMVKLQQKVSGCFRSEEGATAFCRVRSYISTMRKQGQSVLLALEHVFLGKPFYPQVEG